MSRLIQLSHLPSVALPQLLMAKTPTIGSAVETILDYAKENDFALIVVGTHARKGVPRLFLGSFAERLVCSSPLPVLVTSAKAKLQAGKKIKHIVFPTDFSPSSQEAFDEVATLAKSLDSDVLIFHQEEFIYPTLGYPLVLPPVSIESMEELREECRKKGEHLIQRAAGMGVRAKFHLGRPGQSFAISITKAAKKLPSSIIAMASQSSALAGTLFGSTTRQVIRAATCPVYVIHPTDGREVELRRNAFVPRFGGQIVTA